MIYFVYGIFNILNGKFYIGKSNDPFKRWREHKSLAFNGSNDCPKIYNAIRKYGIDNLEFIIIQKFLLEQESLDAEKYYINYFNAINYGYNCLEDVFSRKGYVTSEKTKQKQSISRLNYYADGNNHPLLGIPRNEITKEKISVNLTGKHFGEKIGNSKLKDLDRIKIINLSDQGHNQRDIAKIFKCSQWSVWNVLKTRDRYEN